MIFEAVFNIRPDNGIATQFGNIFTTCAKCLRVV